MEKNSYEDINEEDIAGLEDNPTESEFESAIIVEEGTQADLPDMPIYRLRLPYSNEIFFAAYQDESLKAGSMVLVPTRYGRDLAQIITPIRKDSLKTFSDIVRIQRPATDADLEKAANNKSLEGETFTICKEKIAKRKLNMKLISVHYLLEDSKILFFFSSDSRVDFRELVKDLVSVFKVRIELRQIGVRDESRMIGGFGVCGRGYCCHVLSEKFKPVSIKMAKEQNLSLNSMKISGCCGRLLCCIAYEHCFYSEQRKLVPPEGGKVFYDGTLWKVVNANLLVGKVKLIAEDGREVQLPSNIFEKVDGKWRVKISR
jgi:cell fate regulator YaaT (PSP1 superfamily)